MKRFYPFLQSLGAIIAGVLSSVALGLLTRIVFPENYFNIGNGPDTDWGGYVRVLLLFSVVIGMSGLVAGLLSPARWPGPVLGVGWLSAALLSKGSARGSWELLDYFEICICAACLVAPLLLYAFAVAGTRRRRARRRAAEEQLQELAQ